MICVSKDFNIHTLPVIQNVSVSLLFN
uniref:Uncharacterized protein n=1 Tax=Arundo donax TaxID=35708 RepID=A0A0A9ESP8_ARUDO